LPLLARIFEALHAVFRVAADAEITLEANPGTVNPPYLAGLRNIGVNRLSLGAQSACDDELRILGRIHTWAAAVETVSAARAAGFANLSLDFIYGLPGQTLRQWRETLEAALALAPRHLSLYALTVEENTLLERDIARGVLPRPDSDEAADMFELAEEVLARAGYFHYEISNWARAGADVTLLNHGWHPVPGTASEAVSPFVCRHNLVYWRNQAYLGFGAAAASWWGGRRWTNVRHPGDYVEHVARGKSIETEVEVIDSRLTMGETMMMGLRLAEGVSEARFRARFGVSLEAVFAAEIDHLRKRGLLDWDGQVARLTAQGRLLGNLVFGRFLPDRL
jgi:oxygen-independent coproporphyrinogen-3 oxidase